MKKIKILVASLVLVGAVVTGSIVSVQNQPTGDLFSLKYVEALAQSEGHTTGGCRQESGPCQGYCCCGNLVYVPNIDGPSYNIKCCQ